VPKIMKIYLLCDKVMCKLDLTVGRLLCLCDLEDVVVDCDILTV